MARTNASIERRVAEDMIGRTFGRLTVLARDCTRESNRDFWSCRCVCGKTHSAMGPNLRSGATKSCGCLMRERVSRAQRTHGLSDLRAYQAWFGAHQRCYDINHKSYKNYGGRGVTVCERWHGEAGLVNFLADMGEPKPDMSIDRIDNNGPYAPGNCRWATRTTQARNKRCTIKWTVDGVTMTAPEWAERTGFTVRLLRHRVRDLHWSVERAITTPVQTKYRRKT
jgi:hypothetical protein